MRHVSPAKTLLLGAIAGVTIFAGVPIGRLRHERRQLRAFLTAVAIGVLVFILYDVLANGIDPIAAAVAPGAGHVRNLGRAGGLGAVFAGGLAVGLLSLDLYDAWLDRRRRVPPTRHWPLAATGAPDPPGRARRWRPRRCPVPWPAPAGPGARGARGNSRCSSPRASACTTSPRGWPSGRLPPGVPSVLPRCSSSVSPCTTPQRGSASRHRWPAPPSVPAGSSCSWPA